MKKHFYFLVCILFFLFASCKTLFFKNNFVYSISQVELKENNLDFLFQNYSKEKITKLTVYFELEKIDFSQEFSQPIIFEQTFELALESQQSVMLCVQLSQILEKVVFEEEDLDLSAQEFLTPVRIYAKEIIFESGQVWKDTNGNYCF